MYQKEIVYLSLFENDIKSGSVGYLKIEKRQENYSIELQVKNVPNMFMGNYPIRLQGENDWKEAAMLSIKDGCGKWTGIMSEPIARAEVLLADSYKIKGESKKAQTSEDAVVSTYEEEVNSVQTVEETNKRDNNSQHEVTDARQQNNSQQTVTDAEIIKAEKVAESIKSTHYNNATTTSENENPPLYESKWEQLLATYDQINPYGDNRVYIKLEPKDFVVLRSNYQHLVNNSFLLHGFYNYRYVILGKERDFYIGVPGVFYEREKMVALMFGFEAFECEGGDAEEGKFGYYLRKVEI